MEQKGFELSQEQIDFYYENGYLHLKKVFTEEQCLDLIEEAVSVFGLKKGEDFWYRLSLGDRKDEKKYFKKCETILRTRTKIFT